MRTRSIQVTEHFDSFIENGVQTGRFRDISEVIGEGLRLLEQREAEDQLRLEWLRSAATEGFASLDRGEGLEFASVDELEASVEPSTEALIAHYKLS